MPIAAALSRSIARTAAALLFAALAGCATTESGRSELARWQASDNFDARRPTLVVLHHTELRSFATALDVLRRENGAQSVSAHYLIGADGRIVQLVDERDRAWHAGASRWAGRDDVNSASIGIELDNDGVAPYTEAQIGALIRLLGDVIARWKIPRELVVAHGDVAPTRKADPGPNFPWERLAAAGFGLWPRPVRAEPPLGFDPWLALRVIGYDVRDAGAAARAFHRHFRGASAEVFDAEDLAILYDLQRQLTAPSAR